jgi:hypothetical protein
MNGPPRQFSILGILKTMFVIAALLVFPMETADLPVAAFALRILLLGIAAWLIPDLVIQWCSTSKTLR